MLTVTADVSADLRRLKGLAAAGKIRIFAVEIENHVETGKIKNKELPILVIGSKIATIGNSVIAPDGNSYLEIESVIGRQNHADVLHLERHFESGRDYFVTDDNDFLAKKAELLLNFGIKVVTVDEIERLTAE